MKVLSDKIIDDVLKQKFWDDNHPPAGAVPSDEGIKAEEAALGEWCWIEKNATDEIYRDQWVRWIGEWSSKEGYVIFQKTDTLMVKIHHLTPLFPIAKAEDKESK